MQNNARVRPNAPAYYEKIRDAWVPTPWHEYDAQVRQASRALLALGIKPGNIVTILGFNRPEWVIVDLAAMLVGGAAAGIYTTNSASECQYVINHSESPVILLENEMQWKKIESVRDDLPALKHVVMMKGTTIADEMVLTWEQFLAKGDEVPAEKIDECLNSLEMGNLATLIYTSGTTGPPKGVMLSHKNLASTAENALKVLTLDSTDSLLSYLPLSHIAEQMFTIHAAITAAYQVFYAQYSPQEHLASNLQEVQPTIVFGVPRIWEKFHSGVSAKLAESTGVRAKLAAWAQGVGKEVTDLRNRGQEPTGMLAFQYNLASKLIFSKIRAALGFTNTKYCLSGAAPLSPEVMHFFGTLDIPIYEIYGQSEDCGPSTTNRPGEAKFGSVGKAWPEAEVKLADDGEILVKGPNVFLGYYKNEAATANDLRDGWLYSGDLGQFDEEGFLHIVGRKKEIIITSGGKNIAPKNIEAALKNIELVSQAVVIGEQRRFISALITLDPDAAMRFAQENGLEGKLIHEHPKLLERMQQEIDQHVNSHFARVEQVREFRILPRDFTVEDGELTPTLKIKRRMINENFANEIESMYAG
ncbi:MAG: long-chain fatty acid--CoA ligase [Chloroflexi bacterium]|nr:MAG: long-chain fatty acid--CoA ligase [Chloroflexota bacterium]